MDRIKELRDLAFATRLKRLSERLSKDVSLLYKNLDIDFEAKWFSIISILLTKNKVSITEIAANLEISHTAVNQISTELINKGYISSEKDNDDERQRLLTLTDKGKKLCKKLEPIWEEIRLANKELIDSIDANLLQTLDCIESELDKLSMYERVWKNIYGVLPGTVKIVGYNSKFKKHFKRLNIEWLEEFFTIEDKDLLLLNNPKEKIIDTGGQIFFAILDNEVVGTCALILHDNNEYELAKMAVTKRFQNRGIGKILINTAINWLQNEKINELYLLTSEKLISANILYRQLGFTRLQKNPFDQTNYKRKTYAMKLTINEPFNNKV